jgi:MFS family permease
LFIQVIFKKLYPDIYTSTVSTRVSNALLVGDIIGMLAVGLICDRIDRKTALVGTTLVVILGTVLATAAHGTHGSLPGLFWFLTFARGITGVGVGGEYPASSTSASEAADEKMKATRGPGMIYSSKPYTFPISFQLLSRLPTSSLVLEALWL